MRSHCGAICHCVQSGRENACLIPGGRTGKQEGECSHRTVPSSSFGAACQSNKQKNVHLFIQTKAEQKRGGWKCEFNSSQIRLLVAAGSVGCLFTSLSLSCCLSLSLSLLLASFAFSVSLSLSLFATYSLHLPTELCHETMRCMCVFFSVIPPNLSWHLWLVFTHEF